MGMFQYIHPDEVAQRHRARNVEALPRQEKQSEHRNVEVVLSLGDVRYIMYRTKPYRIPPVPFKLGQRVLASKVRMAKHAKDTAMEGQTKSADAFYREMGILARLMWRHIRPSGKVKRALWRMGLLPNPFLSASEEELRQVADFFLKGRMTSSVRSISETEQ